MRHKEGIIDDAKYIGIKRNLDLVICTYTGNTVKPVLSGHSKIDKTNGSLMKVESIADSSFALSDNGS